MRCMRLAACAALVGVWVWCTAGGSVASANSTLPAVHRIGDIITAGAGSLVDYGGLKVLHLKGTPWEIGVQHGLLLGAEAVKLRPYVDPAMQPHQGMDAVVWRLRDLYMDTKLLPTFTRNIPTQYIDEMQGFVNAASGGKETDIKPVISANVAQELALYMCTSVAGWGSMSVDGRLYHARNLDNNMPMEMIKSAVVMIVEPQGKLPFITLSYPANFGVLHAMNNQGITVSMNYSFSVDAGIDGIPFPFLLREIVENAQTLEQAIEIVRQAPRTIGLNIMIGDSKIPRAVVVEVSANHYAVRTADAGFLSATNRYAAEPMRALQQPGWYSSATRDERLDELAVSRSGAISAPVMAEILRDKFAPDSAAHQGLLQGIDNAATMASVIFDPERQLMWVGVQDEAAPAPDRTLAAFSLADALAGREARRADLDIPVEPDSEYRRDWLALYRAEQALTTGSASRAQGLLQPLLEQYPNSEYVLREAALCAISLGQWDAATAYFRRLADLPMIVEPRWLQEAAYYLGILADIRGDRQEALDWYRRSLAVVVPDLGGDSDRFRRQARIGLTRPLGKTETLLGAWWHADVFNTNATEAPAVAQGRVASISVQGAHRTQAATLLRWLGIRVGQMLTAADLQTMRKALLDLDAFDNVTITAHPADGGGIDVVIRLQEGFGLYRDPAEFAVNTAIGLLQQNLSLRYENVAGRAINIGGAVGWGASGQRTVYAETPVRIGAPMQLRLQAEKRITGVSAGVGRQAGTRITLDRSGAQLGLSMVLSPEWTLTLNGQYFADSLLKVTSPHGYQPPVGQYALISAGLTRRTGTTTNGTQFNASTGILWQPGRSDTSWPRYAASLNVKKPISSNMQIATDLSAGYVDRRTPLAYQFRLGGSQTLRGYDATVVTPLYTHATMELRRYVRSDAHAALFADAAVVDTGDGRTTTLWSPGLALRYRTPVNQTCEASVAWAPDTQTWRWQAGFSTNW